jgi:hypothetical protein
MIAASGVPRSGTSLLMNILIVLLGEAQLIGSKFMGRDEDAPRPERKPRELNPIQEYNQAKREGFKKPDKKKDFADMKDMNPNGFFECPFTVQGLYWRPQVHELMKRVDDLETEPFCKIVSNGLLKSDPTKISKIVYMLRDPHEVAKSQERLGRQFELPEGEKIHSPDFFITATVQFCRWAVKYAQDVEIFIVNHGHLLASPVDQVESIAEFLGVNPGNAAEIVEQKLHRSKAEDIPHPQWGDADRIYDLMQASDFKGVLEFMANPELETHKAHAKYHCHRLGATVVKAQCELCKSNPVVMQNFKKTADKKKINWKSEPCAFECGSIPGDEPITIDESISKNHWNEVPELNCPDNTVFEKGDDESALAEAAFRDHQNEA